jgi:hypothetical protein
MVEDCSMIKNLNHLSIKILYGLKKLFLIIILVLLISFNLIGVFGQTGDDDDFDSDGVPNKYDSDDDGDGFEDTVELEAGTDPFNKSDYPKILPPDNDGDLIPDSIDPDDDNDGLTDLEENIIGLNHFVIDTDRDRIHDKFEIDLGTNPLNKDSDGDSFFDGDEIYAEKDPLDEKSYPTGLIANAGIDQIVFPNSSIIFEGVFSIGEINKYQWDFDDSNGIEIDATGNKVEHYYSDEGIYNVTLTVSDGKATAKDCCMVYVNTKLAAELDIIKNRKLNYVAYQKWIEIDVLNRTNSSIKLRVDNFGDTEAIIGFSIDPYSLILHENEKIRVLINDKEINENTLKKLLENDSEESFYNLHYEPEKMQFYLVIPSINNNSILIEKVRIIGDQITNDKIEEGINPNIVFYGFALAVLLILIISAFKVYSSKKEENKLFYQKLVIDDEDDIDLFNQLKNDNINWEDYDSEV